ncbi:hypothetical protein N7493_001039 [Penicillium malachiteum]|uniref:Uncharacterized protein n=1 Tax=Penicillium malachiteum TaxID=1324776 RepID=A0AAD6HYD3_9EURO|nr:hypothetical protein N7493_001039 [Penicillium malachiteum]
MGPHVPGENDWANVMQELIGLQQSQERTLQQLWQDQQRLQYLIQMVASVMVSATPPINEDA